MEVQNTYRGSDASVPKRSVILATNVFQSFSNA